MTVTQDQTYTVTVSVTVAEGETRTFTKNVAVDFVGEDLFWKFEFSFPIVVELSSDQSRSMI